jgi:magnesium transporter
MLETMDLDELHRLIDDNEASELHEYINERNAYDIAALLKELEDDDVWKLCSLLQDDDLARILEEADDDQRVRLTQSITNDELIEIFGFMQKDDITDIIGDMPVSQRKALLNHMMVNDREIIRNLLKYPEDSAGGIMTTAFISLRQDMTVTEGMKKIREIANKTEVIETIYITNEKRALVGTVNLRHFLTAKKNMVIKDVMKENPIYVHPDDDQEEVAKLVSRYDLTSIPVVNNRGSILGIITVDDVIDVIVEEYNEDILELAGVSKEESLTTSLGESIKLRLPWLLVNLATAFLASMTVKAFEGTIAKVVALSATMTIVTGMGGNGGSQTQSIMVRAISQDDFSFKRYWKSFVKEIVLGIIDGAVTGLITGLIVAAVYHNIFLGIIILIAMIANMVVAGVFGFLVPLVLKRMGADPAVSSSIFITTATDVLGFFIFLGLANMFLKYLI